MRNSKRGFHRGKPITTEQAAKDFARKVDEARRRQQTIENGEEAQSMAKRNPEIAFLPVTFQANRDHVVAIYQVTENSTIGIRFQSPEMLLEFMSRLMEKAAKVWPENQYIQEYLSED